MSVPVISSYFDSVILVKESPLSLLHKLVGILLASTLTWPHWAQADIYAYTDENGEVHLTDRPDDHRYRLALSTPNNSSQDNPGKARINRTEWRSAMNEAATRYGIDPKLVEAIITVESGFNSKARSAKGAMGLMQLMPETARRFHVANPYDPFENIDGGTRYLSQLLQLFNNDLSLTIAAYNAGENAVIKYGRAIPPYQETQTYVPRVLRQYDRLRRFTEASR